MTGYPALLDLAGRRVLVVGGGAVAARRVRPLIDSGAAVVIVAPTMHSEIEDAPVEKHHRAFVLGDVDDVWLVIAATDDPDVNARIATECERRRIFCVRADDARGGSARSSAAVRKDGLVVAVNGGDDPRRSTALRDAISYGLDVGSLPSRPARTAGHGSVALIGGGPGDPDLITVRGRRLLAAADVVIVDRLAPRSLLDELPRDVEIIDCGKAPHRHNLTQEEINALLVDRARRGSRVVRLKGGDPFVFGRGGEELLACVAAGVPVTVVPGVSSVLAAPAAANIPLTHRGLAADFTVVSGHLDPGRPSDGGLDWPALASGTQTLVLLMAMQRLGAICDGLIEHGRDAATPAAAIRRATLPDQQVVRAPLAKLASAVAAASLTAPAVVVIGNVVAAIDPVDPHDTSNVALIATSEADS